MRKTLHLLHYPENARQLSECSHGRIGNAGAAACRRRCAGDLYLDLVAQYVGIKYDAPEGVGGAALFNPTFIGQVEQARLALQNAEEAEGT